MANNNAYPNPLDNFRSYSYHYVMILAPSTEAVRKMMATDTAGNSSVMSKISTIQPGGAMNIDGTSAYLVLDTRRFSQYTVQSLDMTNTYGTGDINNPAICTSEIKMTVQDSTGLTFFNFIMDIYKNKMQVTRAGAVYLIGTLFIGHTDGNPQQTTLISSNWMTGICTRMGFKFSHSGSIYDMSFVETEGNPGAGIGSVTALGDIQSLSNEGSSGNTVGTMLEALERRLNIRSLQYYQKLTNKAALTAAQQLKLEEFKGAGKLVQYMITWPEAWGEFEMTAALKSQNKEQQFVSTPHLNMGKAAANATKVQPKTAQLSTAAKASYMSFTDTTTVFDAIKMILESSKSYLDLGSEKARLAGTAKTHKVVTSVTSNDSSFLIHYDIYEYSVPKQVKNAAGELVTQASTKTAAQSNIPNYIEYDYLFSGKNSHIIDLDIQFDPNLAFGMDGTIDLGGRRFADNAAAGQEDAKVEDVTTGEEKTTDSNTQLRANEPLFPPLKTKDQKTNFASTHTEQMSKTDAVAHIRAKQEFTTTLAYMHYLSVMHLRMRIRGNPQLMRKFSDRVSRGFPPHTLTLSNETIKSFQKSDGTKAEESYKVLSPALNTAKSQYYNQYVKPRQENTGNGSTDALMASPDVSSQPVLVKINIYSPNVDFNGENLQNESLYTNKFFYNGLYMLLSCSHSLHGGSFEQELQLIPYNMDGSLMADVMGNSGPSSKTSSSTKVLA